MGERMSPRSNPAGEEDATARLTARPGLSLHCSFHARCPLLGEIRSIAQDIHPNDRWRLSLYTALRREGMDSNTRGSRGLSPHRQVDGDRLGRPVLGAKPLHALHCLDGSRSKAFLEHFDPISPPPRPWFHHHEVCNAAISCSFIVCTAGTAGSVHIQRVEPPIISAPI